MGKIEFRRIDSNGGPCYIGTGCFHRRESLCGKKYSKACQGEDWTSKKDVKIEEESVEELEETCKSFSKLYLRRKHSVGKVGLSLYTTHACKPSKLHIYITQFYACI